MLIKKTLRALVEYKPKSVLLAGGVAANTRLKNKFKSAINKSFPNIKLFVPSPELCTDNAAYIASHSFYHNNPVPWQDINADPQLTITSDF